jgi:hypothetical protein
MSDITINNLTPAGTIDGVLDLLPIYQDASGATLSINRNTYLNLTSGPVGLTDAQTVSNKIFINCTFSGALNNPVFSGTVTGTYTIGGTVTFPSDVTITTAAQTLTNKTINGGNINNAAIASPTLSGTITGTYTIGGTVTFPANVVITDASQTLTNKTLSTGSVIDSSVNVVEVLKKVYPVGSIYMATVATNPATLLGFGTWAAFAAGRTIFGKAGSGTFVTAGSTGGAESINIQHSHSTTSDGSHTHSTGAAIVTGALADRTFTVSSPSAPGHYHDIGTSGGHAHSISSSLSTTQSVLNPYIVTYIWERTA